MLDGAPGKARPGGYLLGKSRMWNSTVWRHVRAGVWFRLLSFLYRMSMKGYSQGWATSSCSHHLSPQVRTVKPQTPLETPSFSGWRCMGQVPFLLQAMRPTPRTVGKGDRVTDMCYIVFPKIHMSNQNVNLKNHKPSRKSVEGRK